MEMNKPYNFEEIVYLMSTDEFEKVDVVEVTAQYRPFDKYPVDEVGRLDLPSGHDFPARLASLRLFMDTLIDECLENHGEGSHTHLDEYSFRIVATSEDRDN